MAETLLQLSNIGKRFGGNPVLEDVSLDLRAGEVHVLAGGNGAGKSTLIKVLAGVHGAYEGTVELLGARVRFADPADARRRGISVIHQELSLVGSMSVEENLSLGREPCGALGLLVDRKEVSRGAREVCRELGLGLSDADLARPAESFPLAVRNLIEVAKALAGDARILVMDEPTSALGRAEVDRLLGLVSDLRARGCGILFVSHRMEEIYRIADRITVLRDGRRVGTVAASACPEPELIRMMIGRDLGDEFPESGGPPPDARESPRLVVRNLTVRGRHGLPDPVRGLSVYVRAGEIVGLAGLQGSGISEALGALFGAHGDRLSGTIELDGELFRPQGPSDSILRGLAFLTGDRGGSGIVPTLPVAANVTLASLSEHSARGFLSPESEARAARRWSDDLSIRCASMRQEAGTLSGGNQQKVVLAKWLAARPRILLLEEPTRGIDVGAKHDLYAVLRRLAREGMAILMTSTETDELLGLCDRILVLHRGSVTASLPRAEATAGALLAAAMDAGGEGRN
jgi:ABC-type sugar transport system ATPase subunit